MFVVWRKRPIKGNGGAPFLTEPTVPSGDRASWKPMACHHRGEGRIAWTPLLVIAERVDGKPRQRVVYRFPTIRTCCIEDRLNRAAWWHSVLYYLNHIDEVWCEEATFLPRDRPDIMAKLRERVPDPTPAGRSEFKAFRTRREREAKARDKAANDWWKKHGPGRSEEKAKRARAGQSQRDEEKYRRAAEDAQAAYEAFRRTAEENPEAWRRAEDLLRQMNVGMSATECYSVLGIQAGATTEQVKAAYRRLAMIHHPDKGGSPEEFRRLKKAHDLAMSLARVVSV